MRRVKAAIRAPLLFVDTSAWVALATGADALHASASAFYRDALSRYRQFVTTTFVLAETYALLRREHPTHVTVQWLVDLMDSAKVHVVYVGRDDITSALVFLQRYADQSFSLTDAVSFTTMRQQGMKDAFAFDHHFATAGFVLRPG